jgi:hypothetical protein
MRMMLAIGDIAERCLRFFGITKERVQAVAGTKDCGCDKRQTAMNQWGYRWQSRLLLPYYWLQERVMHSLRGVGWSVGMRFYMAGRYMGMAFRVLFYGR